MRCDVYSLCFKLYTNYTLNPTLQLERQRDKETKSQRVKETKRGRDNEAKSQRDKKTKSGREEGRKTKGPFFETLMFMNLIH